MRPLLRPFVLLIALTVSFACHSTRRVNEPHARSETSPADLVIVNARIWTGHDTRSPGHERTAVAVDGNRIALVGMDSDAGAYIGPQTRIIDAGGRRVIPGMTDSHTHIIGGGLQLARLNLRDVKNRDEFIRAVQTEADHCRSKNQWVLGGRWSTESWPDREQPNKSWIDPVTGDTPVFLNRMDGHQALVNSAALRLAGIDVNGPSDPVGGEIERDPKTGEPTGILKESAMDLVEQFIPPPSTEERVEALQRAMKHANSFGITSIHDMSELGDLEAFRIVHSQGEQTVRIVSYLSVSNWTEHLGTIVKYPISDDRLRVAGFKGYMDGSLGSRTACLREPYADATPESRYPRGQLTAMASRGDELQQMIRTVNDQSLQVALHAIGDQANHLALNYYEKTKRRRLFGPRTRPNRIEHVQHLHVSDITRFGRSGVIASMQPYHKADDARYAEQALGKERLRGSYAFRQLVDSGALLIFGSDWPVVTLNPWAGIDSAVNARTLDGTIWLADHSLTLEEAIHAYTASPAQAIGRDGYQGRIRKNYHADLVILDDDPFTIPRERLGELRVWKTIFDGQVVFERESM